MMVTAPSVLEDYKARLEGVDLIGSVLWFELAGEQKMIDNRKVTRPVRVSFDDLEFWFDELGLDKSALPPRIREVDAFRNATSTLTRKYVVDGNQAEVMAREVSSGNDYVVRHVMREVKDSKGQRLLYEQMATVRFRRPVKANERRTKAGESYEQVILNTVRGVDLAEVKQLLIDMRERYKDLCVNLHANSVRATLRQLLTSMNAIPMRRGGVVYFVHAQHWPQLDGIQELVRRIGQGCRLDHAPLPGTPDRLELLAERLADDVQDEVNILLSDIREANDKAKLKGHNLIDSKKFAELRGRYDEIRGRSVEYVELLDLRQERASDALEVALRTITDMATRVKWR